MYTCQRGICGERDQEHRSFLGTHVNTLFTEKEEVKHTISSTLLIYIFTLLYSVCHSLPERDTLLLSLKNSREVTNRGEIIVINSKYRNGHN